jgi:hypothetical protein
LTLVQDGYLRRPIATTTQSISVELKKGSEER